MMKRLISGICAAAMAASLYGASAPAFAGTLRPASIDRPASSDVVKIDWRRHRWSHAEQLRGVPTSHHRYRGHWGGHRHWRGHRHGRYYYRHRHDHDNFIGPAAGFLAGALLGGMIANTAPRATYYGNSAHVRWCYSRYRSYRASDNTFQPYHGPRRQCISPYY